MASNAHCKMRREKRHPIVKQKLIRNLVKNNMSI